MANISAICIKETEKAFQIFQGRDEPVWVPRSQCSYVFKGSPTTQWQPIKLKIPEWLRSAKNLRDDMN